MGTRRDKVKRAVRKTVKWGGAGLTVLLVAVWIGSGWVGFSATVTRRNHCLVGYGHMTLGMEWEESSRGLRVASWSRLPRFHLNWWFKRGGWGQYSGYTLPLWFPALLSLLATAAAWRADVKHVRRARAGLCGSCGYDRAGLPAAGAVCPECGTGSGVVKKNG